MLSILDTGAAVVTWFPQEYANEFFVIKGIMGLISTLMLLYHMNRVWPYLSNYAPMGQRLRYYALLSFSVLVTGSTAEQVQEGALVNYRNLGTIVVIVLLIVAMVQSIKDDNVRRDGNDAEELP